MAWRGIDVRGHQRRGLLAVAVLWVGRIGLHVYARQMTDDQLALDAAEHEAIIEAIQTGDEDTAERLTREHIEHALDILLGRVDAEGHALSERQHG